MSAYSSEATGEGSIPYMWGMDRDATASEKIPQRTFDSYPNSEAFPLSTWLYKLIDRILRINPRNMLNSFSKTRLHEVALEELLVDENRSHYNIAEEDSTESRFSGEIDDIVMITDQKKVADRLVSVLGEKIAGLTDLVQLLQSTQIEQTGALTKLPEKQETILQGIMQVWDNEISQMDVLLDKLGVFIDRTGTTTDDVASLVEEYLREDAPQLEIKELVRSCVNALGAMQVGISEVQQSVRLVKDVVIELQSDVHTVKQSCYKLDQMQSDVERLKGQQLSSTTKKRPSLVERKQLYPSRKMRVAAPR